MRAIFFIHQLNQKQLLSLYSLNSLKSCNINLACFTLTDLRHFFEMIFEQSDSYSILLFYMNAKDGYAAAEISTTPNYVFKTIESHH